MGYYYCLNKIREMPAGTLLINQHVTETFAFTPAQLDHMTATLKKRKALLAELFPFDDANYGIDERWIRFFPYAVKSNAGHTACATVKILNHSPTPKKFEVTLNAPAGFRTRQPTAAITVPPRTERQIDFDVTSEKSLPSGTYVITADIKSKHEALKEWTEAVIQIE
jgi:hypothetical protein